jgi:hypothetical protein
VPTRHLSSGYYTLCRRLSFKAPVTRREKCLRSAGAGRGPGGATRSRRRRSALSRPTARKPHKQKGRNRSCALEVGPDRPPEGNRDIFLSLLRTGKDAGAEIGDIILYGDYKIMGAIHVGRAPSRKYCHRHPDEIAVGAKTRRCPPVPNTKCRIPAHSFYAAGERKNTEHVSIGP